jgi:nitrate reductase NapAB chaperone NapD
MVENALDIQCNKILKGLQELENLLNIELTYDALDLENNAQSVQNKDILNTL